jgi:hypothetical protein
MAKKPNIRLLPICKTLALLALTPASYASENFLIEPNGPLPSTVTAGGTATANFFLTNLTSSTRTGYLIKGLPGTVTQNTSGGNCSSPINLNAHARCNLQFTINGEVNSNFAICKGNSCTTATTPLNVSIATNPPPPPITGSTINMISGGTYSNASTNAPLLALSQVPQSPEAGGITPAAATVSYPSTIFSNLPTSPTFVTPDFYGVSCSGSLCIAAGGDDNNGLYPMVAMSNDYGNTWTYPIGGTGTEPSDIFGNSGGFKSASCSGTFCAAAGTYQDGSNFPTGLVAQYKNGGWTFPISGFFPPPNHGVSASLNAVSCSGINCVAGGAYTDFDNKVWPLIAGTVDNGMTWTYPVSGSSGPQPDGLNNVDGGTFLSTSCSGNTCIASGTYEDFNQNDNSVGDVAQSIDGGATWTYPVDGRLLPTNFGYQSLFNGASCSANICVAGGAYNENNSNIHAMLVQSTNGGANWSYAIDMAIGPQPSDYGIVSQFNSASCSGAVCVAGGSYVNTNGDQVPLLAQTRNAGASWTYVIDDTIGPQLPNYSATAAFNTVSCVGNTCTASGTYEYEQPPLLKGKHGGTSFTFPMLAESIEGGPWTYIVDSITGLPSDFSNNGVFNGSSGVANASSFKHNMRSLKNKLLKPIQISN